MTSRQLSVEQGEGKPPAVFEVYLDMNSSKKFKADIFERIRKLAVAIQKQRGYSVVLHREHDNVLDDDELDGLDTVILRVIEARMRYVFFVTDNTVEYIIQKEV